MQDVGVSIGVAFERSISNEGRDREPICSALRPNVSAVCQIPWIGRPV